MIERKSVTGEWKPDGAAPECEGCSTRFTLYNRRHHCRYCGGVFCGVCSNNYTMLPLLDKVNPQRVCHVCWTACQEPLLSAAPNSIIALTGTDSGKEETAQMSVNQGVPSTAMRLDASVVTVDGSGLEESRSLVDTDEYSTSSDSDDVSAGVGAVYSSVEDGPRVSSITFIAALQENLRHADDPDVIKVLMYASPTRHQLILTSVGVEETMQMLAKRLAEAYFRLLNGPFKARADENISDLAEKLRFYSETAMIDEDVCAVDVAMRCRRLVLSTRAAVEWQADHIDSSISDFFHGELSTGCEEGRDGC
ncbi:FYVE zinc finger [Trypanosoma vivax]|nr:FYVE zinc finger [Trypanosoma vivax]